MTHFFTTETLASGRYEVHIYGLLGKRRVLKFDDQRRAEKLARLEFLNLDVYKVKIWDTTLGPVEPNKQTAPGLILHLV